MPAHLARLLTASWRVLTFSQRLPHIHQVSNRGGKGSVIAYLPFVSLRKRHQRGGSSGAVSPAMLQLHVSFARQWEACIVGERCKYLLMYAMNF